MCIRDSSSSNAGTVTDGPASVVFNATPSIAITKFNPGSVVRDVPVTYMIWGTGWGLNGGFGQSGMPFGTGHLSLEDATIVDTLPAGALYVSSNPPGTYDPTSHTVTWSNPTDTRVVYVTVTYPSSVFAITDTVTNGAVITGHPLADPDTELSLIWCQPRTRLAERVTRALSGRSVAAIPLPRTQHAVGNVLVDGNSPEPDGCLLVHANFTVHLYNLKKKSEHVFFGRSEHRLAPHGGGWRIRAKKCVLLNDCLPTLLDFYCV